MEGKRKRNHWLDFLIIIVLPGLLIFSILVYKAYAVKRMCEETPNAEFCNKEVSKEEKGVDDKEDEYLFFHILNQLNML